MHLSICWEASAVYGGQADASIGFNPSNAEATFV